MHLADLQGRRVATSYPGLLGSYLTDRGVEARLIPLEGAVESAIRLGVADAIADVVETGTTLRKAGLDLFGDPIIESEAVLISRTTAEAAADDPRVQQLLHRIDGVLVARNYVLVDYDVDDEHLEAACALTPGFEGPTISSLSKDGWFAVRSLVPRAGSQQLMDDLWRSGARAILVTELSACRL